MFSSSLSESFFNGVSSFSVHAQHRAMVWSMFSAMTEYISVRPSKKTRRWLLFQRGMSLPCIKKRIWCWTPCSWRVRCQTETTLQRHEAISDGCLKVGTVLWGQQRELHLLVSGLIAMGDNKLASDCTPAKNPSVLPCDEELKMAQGNIIHHYWL